MILELGGNDALRGLPLDFEPRQPRGDGTGRQGRGARVLLVGMQVPPNYGRKYSEQFAAIFAEVARAERTALVPLMLKDVADTAKAETMFQPDRMHPVAAAHPTILGNIWPVLEPLLRPGGARARGRAAHSARRAHFCFSPCLSLASRLSALRLRCLRRASSARPSPPAAWPRAAGLSAPAAWPRRGGAWRCGGSARVLLLSALLLLGALLLLTLRFLNPRRFDLPHPRRIRGSAARAGG